MSITAQYAIDLYRSARHETPLPPAPGTHDWRTVRELREAHLESRRIRIRAPRPPRKGGGGRAHGLLRGAQGLVRRLARARRHAPVRGGGAGPGPRGATCDCT